MNLDAILANQSLVLGVAAVAGMAFVIFIALGIRSALSGRNEVVDRLGRVGRANERSARQPIRLGQEVSA